MKAKPVETSCAENIRLASYFFDQDVYNQKLSPEMAKTFPFRNLSRSERDSFQLDITRLMIRFLSDPGERKYFNKFFEEKINEWNGLDRLFQRPPLLVALIREYIVLRRFGQNMFEEFNGVYPGSLQVGLSSPTPWIKIYNFFEFLRFYLRLEERQSKIDRSSSPKITVAFDSSVYHMQAREFMISLQKRLRNQIGNYDVLALPQNILDVGDQFRARESEFLNLYLGYQSSLTEEELVEYHLLINELVQIRKMRSPESDPGAQLNERRLAQAMFTGANYFITPDSIFYHQITDNADIIGDAYVHQIQIGEVFFRMKNIVIKPEGSQHTYRMNIVNLSHSQGYRIADTWYNSFTPEAIRNAQLMNKTVRNSAPGRSAESSLRTNTADGRSPTRNTSDVSSSESQATNRRP